MGWDVKTKSIHEDEFSRICIGSFVIWYNPNWDATFSTEISSRVVVSWLYQWLSFVLKSPITTSNYGYFWITCPRLIQSSVKITKIHFEFDHLEIYKEQQNDKVYQLFSTRNLYICLKDLYRKLLKEENFCNKYKHLHACW